MHYGFPPAINFLFIGLGFLFWSRYPRIARTTVFLSLFSLLLLSLPFVSRGLINLLQYQYPVLQIKSVMDDHTPSAIVVLAGGVYLQAPEYGGVSTVTDATLERLHYGIFLHNKTGIPLLVSGGPSQVNKRNPVSVAQMMADVAQNDFKVHAKWLEINSVNTADEGIYTADILNKIGIRKVILVTNAWHMPRSVYAFKRAGFEIVPAPMGYALIEIDGSWIKTYLPSVEALRVSTSALHEFIGLVWYHIHYR